MDTFDESDEKQSQSQSCGNCQDHSAPFQRDPFAKESLESDEQTAGDKGDNKLPDEHEMIIEPFKDIV